MATTEKEKAALYCAAFSLLIHPGLPDPLPAPLSTRLDKHPLGC